MNSKVYRCGYCGDVTDENGIPLDGEPRQRVINLLETYGDSRTHKTHGSCCQHEWEEQRRWVQVTREMAHDAGDPNMEGAWVKW